MYRNVISSFSLRYAVAFIMMMVTAPLSEVRSGFCQYSGPTADSTKNQFDFSAFTTEFTAAGISVASGIAAADCSIKNGHLYAPLGVCHDSALDESLRNLITDPNFPASIESRIYLDSIMKQMHLEAPAQTYVDSLPAHFGAYIIRTREFRYALLFKIREYIGGLDHYWFYWAYQPDDVKFLYKTELIEQPEQIHIRPCLFSGRMDPTFTITDPATIASLTRLAYTSVNTFLNPSLERTDKPSCDDLTPFHIMLLGMFPLWPAYSESMPTIELCSGFTINRSIPATTYLNDPDSQFKKAIIAAGCALQLSYTDSYGTIDFCDLYPDSLKTTVRHEWKTGTAEQVNGTALSITGPAVRYRISVPGVYTIDLFSINGTHIATLARNRFSAGQAGVLPLPRLRFSTGIHFIRIYNTETGANVCLPVTLTR